MQTRHSLKLTAARAVAIAGAVMAVLSLAPRAHATTPKVLTYRDSDGVGQITITQFAPDPATGGQRIQVQLKQNGRTYSGTGFQLRVHQDPPGIPDGAAVDLLVFTLRDAYGRAFLFRGKLQTGGIIGRPIGSGRYEQAGFSDVDQWTIGG